MKDDNNQFLDSGNKAYLGYLIQEVTDAVRMDISPAMAKVMMERNESDEWHNRPKSERNLRRMTRSMKEGRWAYTGQPIIFSVSGRLLNGQHTLTAVIRSEATIESLVAFNVPDESFKYMDIGTKRSAGQILAIENIPNASFIAAMARPLMIYENNPNWAGDVSNYEIDPDEILDFYQSHPDMMDSKTAGLRFNKTNLLPPSWAGFLHYICAKHDRDAADDFFYRVATGIGLTGETDPAFVLRARLEKNRTASNKAKEPLRNLAAYAVKCWNAERTGKRITVLKWRTKNSPNEKFPRAK